MPGKTFVITGATGGLGEALVAEARARGHRVIAVQRAATHPAGSADDIIVADLSDSGEMARKVGEYSEICGGGVDVLINCAGVATPCPLLALEPKRLRELLEVNVASPVALIGVLWSALARRGGCVVNIGSIASRLTLPLLGPYSASKSALLAITDAVRLEGRPFGIRSCYVELGNVRTGIHLKALAEATGAVANRDRALLMPLRPLLDRAAARSLALSQSAMPPKEVARDIIDLALRDHAPRIAMIGRDAWLRYFLTMLIPRAFLERAILRFAGLATPRRR